MTMFDPGDKKPKSSGSSVQDTSPSVGKSPLVDAQPTSPKQAEARAKKDMASIPKMDLGGSLTAFGSTSDVAHKLVEAEKQMKTDDAVAKQTLAMFQFMHSNAGALAAVIHKAMSEIEDPGAKDQYLQDLSAEIASRTTRGLWAGPDRTDIWLGAVDPTEYFQRGKVVMLQKAGEVLGAHKSLTKLLESHSNNQDAKSYGRRLESIEATDVGALPVEGGGSVAKAGAPVALDDPMYTYYDDAYSVVPGSDLVVGEEYALHFNHSESYAVKVGAKTGSHVTFSTITKG